MNGHSRGRAAAAFSSPPRGIVFAILAFCFLLCQFLRSAFAVVAPEMVRELRGTMVREKATCAALLLLTDPTDGMRKEAKSDGQYKSEFYKPVDKIQILSVSDLFNGKGLEVPGMVTTHKSIPVAGAEGSSLELPFDRPKKLAKGRSVLPEQTTFPETAKRSR